jgi:hypothetical protein
MNEFTNRNSATKASHFSIACWHGTLLLLLLLLLYPR